MVGLLAGCGRLGFDAAGEDPIGDDYPGDDGGGGDDDDVPPAVGPGLDDCGVDRTADCGASESIPGGSFLRGNNPMYPANLTGFELDRYEVTVGRFREFLEAGRGIRRDPPLDGDGAHPAIPGSGWSSSWNTELEGTVEELRARFAGNSYSTFTADRGPTDALPINAVTWFEAFAFCIWDGGRLPTHAEYQLAAVGGSEQRVYPWSVPANATRIGPEHVSDTLSSVGSHSPTGDGRWGHADLVGNVDEWSLDYFGTLLTPCTDCAILAPSATRVLHGYWYGSSDNSYAATWLLHGAGPDVASGVMGFRCAR